MPDHSIEQEIQAKGLNAPRITPQDIEASIATEFYFTAHDGIEGANRHNGGWYAPPHCVRHSDDTAQTHTHLLTFCVLVLRNGFTVTGHSACASPENFDAEIGRKIARENAVREIWPLLGYQLREKLHQRSQFGQKHVGSGIHEELNSLGSSEPAPLGMYEIANPEYPRITIGGYVICRQDDRSLWIQTDNGEGGQFSDEVFLACIEEFYNHNF